MEWTTPKRPVDHAEELLVKAILSGEFAIGQALPGERDLAARMGVTRPTLREVIRRLERDGWLDVQQGKATRVKDFWRHGGLNVLSSIVRYGDGVSPDFITNLLEVRLNFAPTYTRAAVDNAWQSVIDLLESAPPLDASPQDYAHFDWTMHHTLTVESGNPVYTLIINGFANFYVEMAVLYFSLPKARQTSADYYEALLAAARAHDLNLVYDVTRSVMQQSVEHWRQASAATEKITL